MGIRFYPGNIKKRHRYGGPGVVLGGMLNGRTELHISFEWCKRFSEDRESTEDDKRPGHLVTVSPPETVTKINQIVRADRRMSIRMIAKAGNADKETVRKILYEELHMTKVCAKLVPKNLTLDQKIRSAQISLKGSKIPD
ncbi:putative mariner transposase [Trichonephila clavipes]|nr:putative mariner transposase [Trichonephila clavipes]